MTTIVSAQHVNKVYKMGETQQHVLKNIELAIKEGEFIAIMGPSGSGKSTLLYAVSGMDQITSGRVLFQDKELTALTEEQLAALRLQTMGFIFQQSHLLKNLTIFDNIILAAYLAKIENRQTVNRRALELMKGMGIEELANHMITQVSGGQLQRAAICRALMNNPRMLFADEPTGALNTNAAIEVMDILADIHQSGTTIMLVTHDIKVAAKTERVLFMVDGQIVAEHTLGTYKKEQLKAREERLVGWLSQLGF
ncbi:ABC transporter ATP-binding protein [Lysinibacillus piscis]|uniref:ABC transporter ATP-binding protein n=1 Tax=Lysinibacillus piscis TaxID=2518931 RepID=A0ABQ5NH51_9BACI|nr:ABC transporter ATP-binding protein [Lysinibacillus sp. KH24]GLC87684.1 ABC transporter ATP-binding protein [Lysinibacillus sp. KH24]